MAFRKKKRIRKVPTNCPFCKNIQDLDYKKVDVLKKYLTEKGKIIAKDRSGICAKHQRRLAREIKKARHLAYLTFTVKTR